MQADGFITKCECVGCSYFGRIPALAVLLTLFLAIAPCDAGSTNAAGKTKARYAVSERFFSQRQTSLPLTPALSPVAGAREETGGTGGLIPHLRIEISATNLNALRRNPRAYVRATVREGDVVYEEVGVHLKGGAGSYRDLDSGEPSLTLNFDKFKAGQKFHGIDKLHLNNSVQDGSLMSEEICAWLFLEAGVPTARVTHARVTLNGRDLGSSRGLYVLKEGYDKAFLRRYFTSDKGNLYDAGFMRDINEDLELDSTGGDVPKGADLKALAAAAQEPDHAKRLERMEKLLDLDCFLSFIALEVITWHWDGYAMKRNNYRVYHVPDLASESRAGVSPAPGLPWLDSDRASGAGQAGRLPYFGKMVFIPHGMDQMFWNAQGPSPPLAEREGLVARALWETSEGRRRYDNRVASLVTNLFTAEKLTNHLNELEARIRPALAVLDKAKIPQWEAAAADLRAKVLARANYLLLKVP